MFHCEPVSETESRQLGHTSFKTSTSSIVFVLIHVQEVTVNRFDPCFGHTAVEELDCPDLSETQ